MESQASEDPPFSTHTIDLEARTRGAEVGKVIVEANLLLSQADPQVPALPELQSLRVLKLDSNPTFSFLKKQLEEYFEETRLKVDRMHPGKSRKWKDALYSSLLKALLELTFTTDQQLRERYIIRIWRWYSEKTQTPLPEVRPRSRTVVQPTKPDTSRLNTVAVSRRSRMDRMEIRKLDSVLSIEARSVSPVRSISPLPKLPARAKAFQGVPPEPFNDSAIAEKLAELQARRQKASSALAHHSFLMKRWGSARSRLDEVLSQRSEMRGIKARIASESSEDDDEEAASPVEPASAPVPQMISLVEKSVVEEDEAPRVQSRVDRLRYTYRQLLPKSLEKHRPSDAHESESISMYASHFGGESTGRDPSPLDLKKHPLPVSSHQRAELQSLRKRLATSNVPCNYEVLNNGLNRPSDLPKEHLSHLFLPAGGEYFTNNPFSDLGKKKKKKGKKKKKKR